MCGTFDHFWIIKECSDVDLRLWGVLKVNRMPLALGNGHKSFGGPEAEGCGSCIEELFTGVAVLGVSRNFKMFPEA
jgi:hypothetical protein